MAATQGFAKAQLNLGKYYAEGIGTAQDSDQAMKWYREAAKQGNAKAQFNLALMLMGAVAVEQSDTEALGWLKLAAEQNYPQAQMLLATSYLRGLGVSPDRGTALAWLKRASDGGYAKAQYRLARMLATGQVEQVENFNTVHELYMAAGESGYAKAQYRLGRQVFEPKELSAKEALRWLKRAAKGNHVAAQYYLGACYSKGLATEVDRQAAYQWFSIAARNGYTKAKELSRKLERSLPSEVVAEAALEVVKYFDKLSVD